MILKYNTDNDLDYDLPTTEDDLDEVIWFIEQVVEYDTDDLIGDGTYTTEEKY